MLLALDRSPHDIELKPVLAEMLLLSF